MSRFCDREKFDWSSLAQHQHSTIQPTIQTSSTSSSTSFDRSNSHNHQIKMNFLKFQQKTPPKVKATIKFILPHSNQPPPAEPIKPVLPPSNQSPAEPFLCYIEEQIEQLKLELEHEQPIKPDQILTERFLISVKNIEHRRPGYRYIDPQQMRPKKKRYITEDHLYLSNPTVYQTSRTGYHGIKNALEIDRQTQATSRRLRRVSTTTTPIPRCATVITKAMKMNQVQKKVTTTSSKNEIKMVFGRRESSVFTQKNNFGSGLRKRIIKKEHSQMHQRNYSIV